MKIKIQVYDNDETILEEEEIYSYKELKNVVDNFKTLKIEQKENLSIDDAIDYINSSNKACYNLAYGGNELSCFNQSKDDLLFFLNELKDF